MKLVRFILFILNITITLHGVAQTGLPPVSAYDAADPTTMRSRINTDLESYFFVGDARFYALRFGFDYGLQNQRHLFGLSLPVVHNIFFANYGGYENTTGIGDLKIRYMFVPYANSDHAGIQRVSAYFEMTAPTGTPELGRGTGSWVYKPGMIFTFRPDPSVAFYPEIRYSFSTKEANGLGGDGAPDQSDPDVDGFIKNLYLAVPAVAMVNSWNGWVGLNATYIRSFSEETYFLFLRLDFGKMIGEKTSAAINITKFIAGQPRLDALVQFKLQFFLE